MVENLIASIKYENYLQIISIYFMIMINGYGIVSSKLEM